MSCEGGYCEMCSPKTQAQCAASEEPDFDFSISRSTLVPGNVPLSVSKITDLMIRAKIDEGYVNSFVIAAVCCKTHKELLKFLEEAKYIKVS